MKSQQHTFLPANTFHEKCEQRLKHICENQYKMIKNFFVICFHHYIWWNRKCFDSLHLFFDCVNSQFSWVENILCYDLRVCSVSCSTQGREKKLNNHLWKWAQWINGTRKCCVKWQKEIQIMLLCVVSHLLLCSTNETLTKMHTN